MESHWAKPVKENQPPFFTSRGKVIEYLNTMLRHKFYHRAKKIPVSEQELKARKKGDKKKDDSEEKKKEEQKATESDKRPEDGEGKSGTTVVSVFFCHLKILLLENDGNRNYLKLLKNM